MANGGGVGRIRTEADLEKFIEDRVEQTQLNKIQGLPGELAERGRTRCGFEDLVILSGGTASSTVRVEHGLGEVPAHESLTILRPWGTSIFGARLISSDDTYLEFIANCSPAVGGDTDVTVKWMVVGPNGVSA